MRANVASTGAFRETFSPSLRAIWFSLAGLKGMPPRPLGVSQDKARNSA